MAQKIQAKPYPYRRAKNREKKTPCSPLVFLPVHHPVTDMDRMNYPFWNLADNYSFATVLAFDSTTSRFTREFNRAVTKVAARFEILV